MCVCLFGVSVLEASQEPQVEDLQLVVQLHADDAVVSVDAQKDARRLAVLSQNHLHLDARRQTAQRQPMLDTSVVTV